ncbi:MAG: GDSL-type esterase/lipase family protein [Opitutaceae bacterium]|jgi:lysophospholipase L1-like esterase|nr:GDSL-type esterase/lipase family protein [Opitutaceae bacterium]
MKKTTRRRLPALLLALMTATAAAAPLQPVAVRDGLRAFAEKAAAGGTVRVAYLGGSITASTIGWRVMTTEFLRREFPDAKVAEIFAAIPGTNSLLGACRVREQVLARKPDLLFVEFAVNNDSLPPEDIRESVEGIVLQTRRECPGAGICFVHTANERMITAAYANGRASVSAQNMDAVAKRHGIPSVHLGIEIARLAAEGRLVAKGPAQNLDADGRDAQGRVVFTSDGIHPLLAGHKLYASVLEPALREMFKAAAVTRPAPAPLTDAPWDNAGIAPVAPLERAGVWERIPYGDNRTDWQPRALTPEPWVATSAGATLTAAFNGTRVGLVGLKGPDNGRFRVTVDKLPPVTGTFFDMFSTEGRYRLTAWWFPQKLAPGPHTLRVELLDGKTEPVDKKGILTRRGYTPKDPSAFAPNNLYLCGILLKDAREQTR